MKRHGWVRFREFIFWGGQNDHDGVTGAGFIRLYRYGTNGVSLPRFFSFFSPFSSLNRWRVHMYIRDLPANFHNLNFYTIPSIISLLFGWLSVASWQVISNIQFCLTACKTKWNRSIQNHRKKKSRCHALYHTALTPTLTTHPSTNFFLQAAVKIHISE